MFGEAVMFMLKRSRTFSGHMTSRVDCYWGRGRRENENMTGRVHRL